ncbi:hypothetical protein GGP41_007444 [Bipolaris sorokiniana]|uniref:Uncharacterized protein n=1 Tax=Cochliobolus sativus TaxID=45130 RepID=A0A8H5ZPV4_COCSA|nr:hypothetical protein GGP41_007444 [Bipolaris sorokiniana]
MASFAKLITFLPQPNTGCRELGQLQYRELFLGKRHLATEERKGIKKPKVVFLYAQAIYFDEGIDVDACGMSRCRTGQILRSHHQGSSGR